MIQPPTQKSPDAHDIIRLVALSLLGVAVVTFFVMTLFPKPRVATGPEQDQPSSNRQAEAPAPPTKTDAQIRSDHLRSLGLDPDLTYPYWPLVYTWPEVERRRYGTRYLVGEVTNYSDERFRYVSLSFGLYKDGVKVADVRDSTAGLGGGETWRYDMFVFYEGGWDTYKVNYLNAY
jgi:hypothetical protein